MKAGFYPRLAATGVAKNRRLYVPYLLTCMGMTAMFYIILFLSRSPLLEHVTGGRTVQVTLDFGSIVVAVFSLIFLFYTNSFLIRKRKKEFGLYNILGMGKWNIARILFWETLLIAAVSLVSGLALGFLLSKLAELCLVNVMRGEVGYVIYLDMSAMGRTCAVFGAIHLLIYLNALRQLRTASARELLSSEAAGEKPPKANWVLAVLGVALLAGAYYLAIAVADPMSAMLWFFVAVIMVIVATYMLFIAGSVAGCKLLQKNTRYYYKPNHFVSVSSMLYRMKRNGAGLASICILATMVLVMISSTTCLYFGAEDSLNTRYPHDFSVRIGLKAPGDTADERTAPIREAVDRAAADCGAAQTFTEAYARATVSGAFFGAEFESDVRNVNYYDPSVMDDVCTLYLVGLADYNRCMGTAETLADDEVLISTVRTSYTEPTFTVRGSGQAYRVKKLVGDFMGSADAAMNFVPSVFVVVPDLERAIQPLAQLADYRGERMIDLSWQYSFDTSADDDTQLRLQRELAETLKDLCLDDAAPGPIDSYSYECKAAARSDYYGTFGGLFFLGALLSVVFLFAAVLIIYYKQISEGYEDQSRFDIMQKLGMQPREIRASINSQLLTVFFLPLAGAVVHLCFAFPMIAKILMLFNLNNTGLFAATSAVSVVAFAALYSLVYRATSNAYYNIVSGAKERVA